MSRLVKNRLALVTIGLVGFLITPGEVKAQREFPSWTREPNYEDSFRLQGAQPVGVAWDPADGGGFWIVDSMQRSIDWYSTDGSLDTSRHVDLGDRGSSVGPIAFDGGRGGLWVVDQRDWTIRLVVVREEDGSDHHIRDELFELDLPETGLADGYATVSGLTCDVDCHNLWLCIRAGHCSRLYKIESPARTYDEPRDRQVVRVKLSTFANMQPRGLAWFPSEDGGGGGCLWSVADNGKDRVSLLTVRKYCGGDVAAQRQRLSESLDVSGIMPWKGQPTLVVRNGGIWAAVAARPDLNLQGLVSRLRESAGPCTCSE